MYCKSKLVCSFSVMSHLHVEREIARLFFVVEDARLVAHVRAGQVQRCRRRTSAPLTNGMARHRGAVIDVRGVRSFVEARDIRRLSDARPDRACHPAPKLKLPVIGRHAGALNGAHTGVPKPAPVGQLMFALRSSHGFS